MNNSVDGKTIENLSERVNIELVNTEEQAKKEANKTEYTKSVQFSEDSSAVQHKQTEVQMIKPKYAGIC